jgi:FAD/FMN-containing dehydrogenase
LAQGIVLFPTNAGDISQAVRFAVEHGIDLAVKGGGHSVAGTSSSDGGLVIDLARMRKVTVDPVNKTITAQGGALWVDVDTAGGEHGLATVGGTVNHTGIGGLTLGGGYGWLTAKYGLVIDNLLSATMVLADGRIVTVSKTENPDLFWAIRGAGHNFGVAVDFTYQAYDQPRDVFCGMLGFRPDKLEAVIELLNSQLETPDVNSGAVCVFAATPESPVPMVLVFVFHNGSEEAGRARFADLYALAPEVDGTGVFPYTVVNSLMNQAAVHGGRRSFKGVYFAPPLRPAFARQILTSFTDRMLAEPEMVGSAMILEYFDLSKACEVPLGESAFANRGSTQNGVLATRWTSPEKDAEMRAWGREFQMMFKKEMDENGPEASDSVPLYLNYAERELCPVMTVVCIELMWLTYLYSGRCDRQEHLRSQYRETRGPKVEIRSEIDLFEDERHQTGPTRGLDMLGSHHLQHFCG